MLLAIIYQYTHRRLSGGTGRGKASTCCGMSLFVLLVWLAGHRTVAASSELSDEQVRVLASVREYALQYSNKLPDYICTQITHRTSTRLPWTPEPLKEMPNIDVTPSRDVVEERLSFVGQRESYEVVAINGKAAVGVHHADLTGAVSAGEFGSLIRHIFSSATGTAFTWKRMDMLEGRSVYVFAYNVPKAAGTHIRAALINLEIVAPYDGLIYVDAQSSAIMRITVSVHLPFGFPIRLIRQVVDYSSVSIAGVSYHLPSHAEVRIQDDWSEYQNKIDFRDYHKFAVQSTLLVGDLTAGPETASRDSSHQPATAEALSEPAAASMSPDLETAVPAPAGPLDERPQNPSAASLTPPASEVVDISPSQPLAPMEKPAAPVIADAPKEPFLLRLDTDLVIVPVVVRDKKGQAVGKLTREDFQLFDKGKAREITSFTVELQDRYKDSVSRTGSEVRAAGTNNSGSSATLNFTLFLFDDMNLKAGELAQVKEAASRQFDRLQPTDRVAILTTSGIEIAGFTADRNQLREALKKLRLLPSSGANAAQCPRLSYYTADLILNNWTPALQAAAADVMQCMLLKPDQAMRRAMMSARVVAAEGEQESRNNLLTIKNAVQWLSKLPGKRSIILISPGFYLGSKLEVEAANVVDEAIRAEVAIGGLDARGLYTLSGSGESSGVAGGPAAARIKFDISRDEAGVATNVMEEMAAGTGGDFVHNTNDLVGGLTQLATPPACTYLLGFKPEDVKMDGSFHALKVKLNTEKSLDLQARRGYFAVKR